MLSKERKENKKDPSAVPSLFFAALLLQSSWHRLMLLCSDFGLPYFTGGFRSAFYAQLALA